MAAIKTGTKFSLHGKAKSRAEAKVDCESRHGYLAIFDNESEFNEAIGSGEGISPGHYWIGMSRDDNGFHWDDGSSLNYFNRGLMNARAGECGILQGGEQTYTTQSCQDEAKYICEYETEEENDPTLQSIVPAEVDVPANGVHTSTQVDDDEVSAGLLLAITVSGLLLI